MRWSATPQAEIAPVQLASPVGLAFWPSGSGWLVEMIQSAFPAVSAEVLSKSTLYGGVAAVAGLWRAGLIPATSAQVSRTNLQWFPRHGGESRARGPRATESLR